MLLLPILELTQFVPIMFFKLPDYYLECLPIIIILKMYTIKCEMFTLNYSLAWLWISLTSNVSCVWFNKQPQIQCFQLTSSINFNLHNQFFLARIKYKKLKDHILDSMLQNFLLISYWFPYRSIFNSLFYNNGHLWSTIIIHGTSCRSIYRSRSYRRNRAALSFI